jgi:O-antigen/teichoic acid export membrane protein
MDFKGPAVSNMVEHLASASTSIAFAWGGHGVWSLVYGHITGSLLSTLVLVVCARWRPLFYYSHAAIKDLYSFGLNIFLKNLLVYGSDKIDYLIIGKQLGPTVLGLYEKAFNIMDIGVKELSMKIGAGVLFSAFSKIQDDHDRLRAVYTKVILTLSLVCFPFFFGLFLVAPSFIYVLFGEKWLPSVVPLQILCVAGLLGMHLHVTSTVINATGRVAPEVWIRAVALILLALGCWTGSFWGINAVAVAVSLTNGLLALIMVAYLGRVSGLTWTDFLRPQRAALVASLFMSGAVVIHQRWSEAALGVYSVSTLLSSIAVGVISYGLALWISRPAAVVSLVKELNADIRLTIQKSA